MAIETTSTPFPSEIEIEAPEEGTFYCYSNIFNLAWSAQDLKLQFCELMDDSTKFPSGFTPRLERLAIVTVSWTQAKEIARMLTQIVAKYEELNGPVPSVADIKIP
jgi:hypothetical protein